MKFGDECGDYPAEYRKNIEDPLEFLKKFRGLSPGNSMNSSGDFCDCLQSGVIRETSGFKPEEVNLNMKKMKKEVNLKRGFTFIEVLMALLIFSIIAISLYSTFSMATSAWRKAEDANRIYREAKWCLDEISRSLKNTEFFDFSQNYPDLKLFDGQADKISFLVVSDSRLKRVSYSLAKQDSARVYKIVLGRRGRMPEKLLADYRRSAERLVSLEKKSQDFLNSLSGQNDGAQISSLTSLVKEGGLKFSYAYKTTESNSLETFAWNDKFESQNEIPKAVQINLTLINPKNLKQEKTFTKIVFIPTGELLNSE